MLAIVGDETIARGDSVHVRFDGFTPDVGLTLVFVDWGAELPDQPIGTATADHEGAGTVAGVVPADAPIREAILRLRSDDGCSADAFIVVLGSADTVAIDDDVVVPGQQVTVTAGGFAPETLAGLTMDVPPTQGECLSPCPRIGAARTSGTGAVVLRGRIPRDTSSGTHQLWVTGESIDGISELQLSVDITVVRGTVPPTDTEPGG